MKRKGRKLNNSISSTTLYTHKIKFCMQIFFFKKRLLEYENLFAVEEKTKKNLGEISKIRRCHQKKS